MKPSSKAIEAELTVLRLLWTRCQARRRWIGYLFLTTASRVNYGYVTDLHVDWYLTQPPEPAQVTSHEHAQQQEYESGWAIPANLSPTSQYAPNGMLRSPLVFQPAKYWRHNSKHCKNGYKDARWEYLDLSLVTFNSTSLSSHHQTKSIKKLINTHHYPV